MIMSKDSIIEIFKFFEFDQDEEEEEEELGMLNQFYNFESIMVHPQLPTIWNKDLSSFTMQNFRDSQNEVEESVYRL